ncbi:MAG: hypothetical protein AB7V08_09530 [Elusimicrobiales bacterium]
MLREEVSNFILKGPPIYAVAEIRAAEPRQRVQFFRFCRREI